MMRVTCVRCEASVDAQSEGRVVICDADGHPDDLYSLYQCSSCGAALLYNESVGIPEDHPQFSSTCVYPFPPFSEESYSPTVPKRVRDDLREAETVFHARCWNAFGAMARRVIHAICAEKRAPAKVDLKDQIEHLKVSGDITTEIAVRMQELRTLGRSGAHPEWEPVEQVMAEQGFKYMHWIVRQIYDLDEAPELRGWEKTIKKR